jgi:hypothetical protein
MNNARTATATATANNDAAVTRLCDAVMRGVANAVRGKIANPDYARITEIMRDEVKGFILADSPRGAEYESAREATLTGMHPGYVVGLIVANSVARILEAK